MLYLLTGYQQIAPISKLFAKKKNLAALLFVLLFLPAAAAADKEITLAAVYAVSGVAAEANSLTLRGVQYAVSELNDQGGLLGRKIHLAVHDNQSTPIGSNLAAKKAAASGAVAIIGSDWSSHSLAVARVAQEQKIPMISSYSTNPEVTKIGNYIFRICFTDEYQGRAIAKFARLELKADAAVILVDVTSDYSLKLSEIFRTHYTRLGGRVLGELEYKLRNQQIDSMIHYLKNKNADLIFIPGHDESGMIAKKAQEAGITALLIGGDGWSTQAFFHKGGGYLKKGYYSSHWSFHLDTPSSRHFIQSHPNPRDAVVNVVLGYDAVMLLADAIRRAASFDRTAIRNAVAATRKYQGITGIISFNETGDPVKDVIIMEIKNGAPHYLKTITP